MGSISLPEALMMVCSLSACCNPHCQQAWRYQDGLRQHRENGCGSGPGLGFSHTVISTPSSARMRAA